MLINTGFLSPDQVLQIQQDQTWPQTDYMICGAQGSIKLVGDTVQKVLRISIPYGRALGQHWDLLDTKL